MIGAGMVVPPCRMSSSQAASAYDGRLPDTANTSRLTPLDSAAARNAARHSGAAHRRTTVTATPRRSPIPKRRSGIGPG